MIMLTNAIIGTPVWLGDFVVSPGLIAPARC
jgi:hypothetical protein